MEQHLIEASAVADKYLTSVGSLPCRRSSGAMCGLPVGSPMACGDPRHRLDFAPGTEVISGSARNSDAWFIRTGILRLQRYSYDGRRQILSLFLPGEIVGYEDRFREGVSVETVTRSDLCRIDRHRFDTMLSRNNTLRAEVFRQKQDQLDRLHWLTWSLGALGPDERLCAFLALSTKFMPYLAFPDGTGLLSMQLPRKDVADLLATTVESVSRIVHRLSETGIIEIHDPTHFRVLHMKKLIALGQIEGFLDKLSRGPEERRNRLDGLMGMNVDYPVCSCGR